MLVTSTSLSLPLIAIVDWEPGIGVILPLADTFRFSPAWTMAVVGFVKLPSSSMLTFISGCMRPGDLIIIMPFDATLRPVLLDELSTMDGRSTNPPIRLAWRDLSRFTSRFIHSGDPVEFDVMLKLPNILRLWFGR